MNDYIIQIYPLELHGANNKGGISRRYCTVSTEADSFLTRIRQPEYTGENRCTLCTVVNVAIAVVVSAVLGTISSVLAPIALGLALVTIYLRGYLVPGTPELTKQYFPDRVLRWFDKGPDQTDAALVGSTEEGEDIDPDLVLLEADVLEFTTNGPDLQLTDEFQAEWRERIKAIHGSEYEPLLAWMLGADDNVDPDALKVQIDDHNVAAFRNDTPVAMWTSEAALVADLAAAPLLQKRLPLWETTGLGVRGQLLHGVRTFLEQCPTCDGDLELSEETRESCCRTAEVATLDCGSCEARLLEVEV